MVLLRAWGRGQRLGVRTSAPALGAHNQEVLRGLGYTEREIEALGGEVI